jgi:hypothetical protein
MAACSVLYALLHDENAASKISSLEGFVSRIAGGWTGRAADTKPAATQTSVERTETSDKAGSTAVTQAPPEASSQASPQGSLQADQQLATEAKPAATEAGFRIEVSALERTWLSIVSDGKRIYSGVLQADQSKILESRQTALIRAGNAGGVEVVFNGKQIGTLGPKGQVRTVVFTKNNYEIVQPTEHASFTGFMLAAFRKTVE